MKNKLRATKLMCGSAKFRNGAGAFALAVALLFSANPAAAANDPPPELRVATTLNDSGAELFYAQDMGFFDKAGLKVTLVPMNNAGAIASAVISGALDVGQLSIPVLAAAHEKGIPFVMIAPSSLYSSDHPTSALVVRKTSPITTAAGLNGKTIAVRDITNIAYLGAKAWIVRNGGDVASVHFVEMPDSAAAAAMAQGRIDAASLSEPDLSAALLTDDRILGNSYDAIAHAFVTGAYFTTNDYAKSHGDAIKKFAAVMRQTAQWANHNRSQSAVILAKYTKAALLPDNQRIMYADKLSVVQVQPVIDASALYQVIKAPFPAGELFSDQVDAAK